MPTVVREAVGVVEIRKLEDRSVYFFLFPFSHCICLVIPSAGSLLIFG